MKTKQLFLLMAIIFFGYLFMRPYFFINKKIINTLSNYELKLDDPFSVREYDFKRGTPFIFFKLKISKNDKIQILQRLNRSLFFDHPTCSQKEIFFSRNIKPVSEVGRFQRNHTAISIDTSKNTITFHEYD